MYVLLRNNASRVSYFRANGLPGLGCQRSSSRFSHFDASIFDSFRDPYPQILGSCIRVYSAIFPSIILLDGLLFPSVRPSDLAIQGLLENFFPSSAFFIYSLTNFKNCLLASTWLQVVPFLPHYHTVSVPLSATFESYVFFGGNSLFSFLEGRVDSFINAHFVRCASSYWTQCPPLNTFYSYPSFSTIFFRYFVSILAFSRSLPRRSPLWILLEVM